MTDQTELEAAIAQIRLEFSAGLPERLRVMRDALASLSTGYDSGAAETFFLQVHSLKGTAGAFEASQLEVHAQVLLELGRRWRGEESVSVEELQQAEEELDLLAKAVEQYKKSVDGRGQDE